MTEGGPPIIGVAVLPSRHEHYDDDGSRVRSTTIVFEILKTALPAPAAKKDRFTSGVEVYEVFEVASDQMDLAWRVFCRRLQ